MLEIWPQSISWCICHPPTPRTLLPVFSSLLLSLFSSADYIAKRIKVKHKYLLNIHLIRPLSITILNLVRSFSSLKIIFRNSITEIIFIFPCVMSFLCQLQSHRPYISLKFLVFWVLPSKYNIYFVWFHQL